MTINHFKDKNEYVGELSTVCSQIVLKCLHSARIDRPDVLWSVNKLAQSITKWTKACDKRLSRWISYIHHKSEFRHCSHVRKDSDFAGNLEDSKSTSGGLVCGLLCFFWKSNI